MRLEVEKKKKRGSLNRARSLSSSPSIRMARNKEADKEQLETGEVFFVILVFDFYTHFEINLD